MKPLISISCLALTLCSSALATTPQAGSFKDGYALGVRNGGLIGQRIRAKTIERSGCVALEELENGTLAVTHGVRPPNSSNEALVAGFFNGYLDSIGSLLMNARAQCGSRSFTSGRIPGELLGAVFCGVHTASVEALSLLPEKISFSPGWSAGNELLVQECEQSLQYSLNKCGLSELRHLENSCKEGSP